MARPLTEKQKARLKYLRGPGGVMRFPEDVHDRRAYEKADSLGLAESDLLQRSMAVQSDGQVLRRFERAYRLTEAGVTFLKEGVDVVP